MAACLLQGEEMKLSGDLPGDFGLCRLEIFRIKLEAVRPAEFCRSCIADLHVDPEPRLAAALGASGDDVLDLRLAGSDPIADCVRPLWQPGKNQPTALAEKIGDEVVGEGFHQVLLIVIARQVAHRRDRDADTWQDARPLCPGSFSNRRQGSLGLGFWR